MSFFGKLFGKGADKDPVTTGEAIQKLRETEDMLMKKQVTGTLFDNFLLTNICRISWFQLQSQQSQPVYQLR